LTDGNFLLLFFTFYDFLSVKNTFCEKVENSEKSSEHVLSETFFQNFWSDTNLSLVYRFLSVISGYQLKSNFSGDTKNGFAPYSWNLIINE
jgi:hypothetical protein